MKDMAAIVSVEFRQFIPLASVRAYELLCDWEDHGRWVPLTKVVVHDHDTFTAYTGVGPLVLRDEMVVALRDEDLMTVVIEKTGPVLTGTAGFSVRHFSDTGCIVTWREHLRVPFVPAFLAPVLRGVTTVLFRRALTNMPV